MKRLIAYVSGTVQQVGYRAKVIEIARAFGLKGMVENLEDGRVHIIADGEDKKLEWFEDAINIKNTLIQVKSIEKEYSTSDGIFNDFGKLVFKGETDSRLDRGVEVMKDILVGVNCINNTLTNMNSNLGGKLDQIKEDTSAMLEKQDATIGILKEVKEDTSKTVSILGEVKEDTSTIKADISDFRKDASESLYEKYEELCREIAEIKATLSEIKAKAA